ncbi:MAG: hypothetical protein R3D85_11625 [Paracoccaceae bacterium]
MFGFGALGLGGNDHIWVEDGWAHGGEGDDTLIAELGERYSSYERLTGGEGEDLFQVRFVETPWGDYRVPQGDPVITDFTPGTDRLEVFVTDGYSSYVSLEHVGIRLSDDGSETLIELTYPDRVATLTLVGTPGIGLADIHLFADVAVHDPGYETRALGIAEDGTVYDPDSAGDVTIAREVSATVRGDATARLRPVSPWAAG